MVRAGSSVNVVLVTVPTYGAAMLWPGGQAQAQLQSRLEIGVGLTTERRGGHDELGKAQHRFVDTNGNTLADDGTLRPDGGLAAFIELYPLARLGIGYRYSSASDQHTVSVDAQHQTLFFGQTYSDVAYTERAQVGTDLFYLV